MNFFLPLSLSYPQQRRAQLLKLDYVTKEPHVTRTIGYIDLLLTLVLFCFSAICVSNYEELNVNSDTHFSDNNPQADHTYAPLNFPDNQKINGHGSNQEQLHRALVNPGCVKGVKSQAYTRAIRPISMEQPVYNLIEEFSLPGEDEPEQDGVNDKEEEPYLEPVDSDGAVHHGARSPEEPVYHTLEQ